MSDMNKEQDSGGSQKYVKISKIRGSKKVKLVKWRNEY